MVNNRNVSAYTGTPPNPCNCTQSCQCRNIQTAKPLYSKEDVSELLKNVDNLNLATHKARSDRVNRLQMSFEELANCIVSAVHKGLYIQSVWCEVKNGSWAACDAYKYRHTYPCNTTNKEMFLDCYFKFAIGKAGTMILVVSCHPS